jgi:hypothetical protein
LASWLILNSLALVLFTADHGPISLVQIFPESF